METQETQVLSCEHLDGQLTHLLNVEELETILEAVADIPVAIFCVTSREKQVLFSSFLKLHFQEASSSDNISTLTIPKYENPGIWIHPPIVINTGERKLAILLMEGRVPNGDARMDEAWSHIVRLSLLLSSHVIMACSNFIPEKIIFDIKNNCGRGRGEDPTATPTLPKLFFLVQDWQMSQRHPFGLKGGQDLLESKLSRADQNTPDPVKKAREMIVSAFEAIHCVLLPRSGQVTKMGVSFDPNYKEFMQEFIIKYFTDDKIGSKVILNEEVLGGDIKYYFEKYVQLLNGQLPPSSSVGQVTSEVFLITKQRESLRFYAKNMKEELSELEFYDEEEFKRLHTHWKESGVEYFLTLHEEAGAMAGQLEGDMDLEFTRLKNEDNKRRRDQLASIAIKTYREMMEESVGKTVLKSTLLSLISEQMIVNTLKGLQTGRNFSEGEEDNVMDTSKLREILKNEESSYLERNRQAERSEFFGNIADNVFKRICKISSEDAETVNDMLEAKIGAIQLALRDFAVEVGSSSLKENILYEKYKKMLMNRVAEHFEKFVEIKRGEEAGKQLVEVILSQYFESMSLIEFTSELNIDEVHDREAGRASVELTRSACDSFSGATIKELADDLNTNLDRLRGDVVEKYRKREEIFEQNSAYAFTLYKMTMESFLEQFESEKTTFQQKNNQEIDQALILYENSCGECGTGSEFYCKWLKDLHNNLDEQTLKLGRENEQAHKKMLDDIRKQKEICVAQYDKEMKNAFHMRNEQKLLELHSSAKEAATDAFRVQNEKRDLAAVSPYLQELSLEMETSYETILEYCKLKWTDEKRVAERTCFEAKQFYDDQMQTRFSAKGFMDPTKLLKIHKEVKVITMDKCVESVTLTEFLTEELNGALDAAFIKYEEKNLMFLPKDVAIGIDLGTTYSCGAIFNAAHGRIEVITNRFGQKITPSYVAFKDGVAAAVGDAAKDQAPDNPENTIYDAKRLIGRQFDDEDLQRDMRLWPFKVIEENESPIVECEGRSYHPEQISAQILGAIKKDAELYLGCSVKKAVITVPAYFNDSQRQATIDAGAIAGLQVLRILNEPTAAAIAYNVQHKDKDKRNVLIFDLGGGTFDVALLEMEKGVIDVVAVGGDTHLGGQDIDNNMVEWLAGEFKTETGVDLLEGRGSEDVNKRATTSRILTRLKYACERTKKILSTERVNEDLVRIDSIINGLDLNIKMTKKKFEEVNEKIFEGAIEHVEKVLKDAKVPKCAVDDIVLVGGSTRIPKIRELLGIYFDGKALTHKINPDEAVAVGAALQAAIMNGQIQRDSSSFSHCADVTPHSIGINVFPGEFSIIIPRNTRVPVKRERDYTTLQNYQTKVDIQVYEGEKTVSVENVRLGYFTFEGIPPAKAGVEKIVAEMEIDEQGVLNVTATCSSNGVSTKGLTINAQRWRLSRSQIVRLTAEHAAIAPPAIPNV